MKIDAHRIRKLRAVLIYFAKYADYTMIDVNATESAMDSTRTSYLTPLWAENDENAKDSIVRNFWLINQLGTFRWASSSKPSITFR